ncbi:transposase [Alkalihalobacillus sp. LMS39]|uniref:transposase n=1 Tax=Alkalihalobacillus sp. LMS39 TaxID=2924032 RepID=UPI001FB3E236|nr:transposase [Alkalihalobacillus sp. LMS39]UOE94816.1 transposase [Alkalihalobacillus sp. LMS39]
MGEQRQRYNEKFKREAVKYVQENKKTVTEIAEDLNVPLSTLHEWISLYREFENEPVTAEARIQKLEQQLREQERELKASNRKLAEKEEELVIVKKAVHIFSRPKP